MLKILLGNKFYKIKNLFLSVGNLIKSLFVSMQIKFKCFILCKYTTVLRKI